MPALEWTGAAATALNKSAEGGDRLDLLRLFALILSVSGHLGGQQVGKVVCGQLQPIGGHERGQRFHGFGNTLLAFDESNIGKVGIVGILLKLCGGHGAGGGGGFLHGRFLLLLDGRGVIGGHGGGGGVDGDVVRILGHSDTPFFLPVSAHASSVCGLLPQRQAAHALCTAWASLKRMHTYRD